MKGDIKTLLYISPELLSKVEDYWHKEKLVNRNTAIIQLIEKGLAAK